MIRKGFDAFVDSVDNFVRQETYKQEETLASRSIVLNGNYNMFKGMPLGDGDVLSSIRDVEDDVMYFMIGFDRVGSPAKIGV